MEISMYKNIELEEHHELQQWLHRKTFWLNNGKYSNDRDYGLYETPNDRQNNLWKKGSYWVIPKVGQYRRIEGDYKGKYDIPTQILLNENFNEYQESRLNYKVKPLISNNGKQKLIEKREELAKQIAHLYDYNQRPLFEKTSNRIIKYLERHSYLLNKNKYGKFSEFGDKLDKAKQSYRGVVCGFRYAYEWMIGEYIGNDLIDKLWLNNETIVEISKEYLAVQMAVKFKKGSGNPTITKEEIDWYDGLIEELKGIKKDNRSIRSYFLNNFDDYIGDPNRYYFWGGPNKTAFGKAFSEIYQLKFNKNLGEKRFKQIFGRDIESLTKD